MYEFSIGAFLLGVIILISGGVFTVYHQPIADNLASGVSSYDRFKMWGIIICGVGIIVMLNIHTIILNLLINAIIRN